VGWRADNDSFEERGQIGRLRMDIEAYERVAEAIFGRDSATFRRAMSDVSRTHVRHHIVHAKPNGASWRYTRGAVGLPRTYAGPDPAPSARALRASRVRAPVLQIHGDRDEVIPYALGERLRDALSPRRFVRVRGGSHNLGDVEVEEEIARFLEEVVP